MVVYKTGGSPESLRSSVSALEELREIETNANLLELLSLAQKVIDQTTTNCPVCQQEIDAERTIADLIQRSSEGKALNEALLLVSRRKDLVQSNLYAQIESLTTAQGKWTRLFQTTLPEASSKWLGEMTLLYEVLRGNEVSINALDDSINSMSQHTEPYAEMTLLIKDRILSMNSDVDNAKRKALGYLKTLEETLPEMIKASLEFDAAKTRYKLTDTLYQTAVAARQQSVETIINEVADTANSYYEFIHPTESIATTQLDLPRARTASITLSADFHGNTENPLLHFSESHLDTLGMAYFLAFRRREADSFPDHRVLMLDDVLHSVDADHRRRVAQLLNEYFNDHQIFITTHDPTFYSMLRNELGGAGRTFIRINGWDLERGPLLGDSLTDIDKIIDSEVRRLISPDDLAGIGGRVMEMICRKLTESLHVSIIAKFDTGYTINDLWPPLLSRLRKQQEFDSHHGSILDQLEENRWVRNKCGAHYNEEVIAPTTVEVQSFASGLAEFYNALFCTECNRYVARMNDTMWACPGLHMTYDRRMTNPTESAE